jgi:hypothetical protein
LASFSFQVPRLGFCAEHIAKPTNSITSVNTVVLVFKRLFKLPPA